MLLDICLGNKSAWRILLLYGESPGAGFTREDLRKHTRLGNKALTMTLNRLVSFGILNKGKGDFSYTVYKLNKESKYIQDILNLLQMERQDLNHLPYDFGIITREFARKVLDTIDTETIYLFGSVAKGTYRNDSDIDFAVVVNKKSPKDDMAINEISDTFSGKYKRKIQCFIMTTEQINNKSSNLVAEILKHGIKIV